YPKHDEVVLQLESCRGSQHRANLTLQLQSVEKAKILVGLLLLHSNAVPSLPTTKSVLWEKTSVTIACLNEEEAKRHAHYFACHYFDPSQYIYTFTNHTYKISSKNPDQKPSDFQELGETMSHRLAGAVSEKLGYFNYVSSRDPL